MRSLLALALFSFLFSGGEAMAFELESSAFSAKGGPASGGQADAKIPAKYTCDGEDVSPPLTWKEAPEGTQSFALISDDPDAPIGTWVHWVLYNLPANLTELPENIAKTETLPNGASQGLTDFRKVGYGGPCPPPGKPHHYFFKLYALKSKLNLPPRATKVDFLVAAHDYILAQAELVGIYERR